jgi:hypothetical protein
VLDANENLSRYYVRDLPMTRPTTGPTTGSGSPLRRLPGSFQYPDQVRRLRSWCSLVAGCRACVTAALPGGGRRYIVPPTGAKGLNLAVSDVVYLAEGLTDFYSSGSTTGLDEYSEKALARVWKSVRFSWWMTSTMHRFPGLSDDFDRRLQRTELEYLFSSENAQRSMAENYVGLPIWPE